MAIKDPMVVSIAARQSMLRIAQSYQMQGKVNQAIELYLRLLSQPDPGTEAQDAMKMLLGLASSFEISRRYHLALDLYERIEEASRA